jgi:hypothetical protein
MAIKNLELYFDHKEGDAVVLKTESGEKISFPSHIAEDFLDYNQKIYLNLDNSPFIQQDNQKKLLNKLLDNNEDK